MKKTINSFASKNKSFGEIQLFRELSRHLKTRDKCTFIDETHQQYVKFHSPTIGCQKRRELSDLWIIAYSPKRNEARMTFLQAKLERRSSNGNFGFKGDYFQHELLSKRPIIIDVSKFNFPNDILAKAKSDSIGSFGVFYFDGKAKLDFAYSTASDIFSNTVASQKNSSRQLYFKHNNIFITVNNKSKIELRCTLDADCFEFGLISLLIGEEIQNDKNVIRFLRKYFAPLKTNDAVVSDFIAYLSTIENDPMEDVDSQEMKNSNIFLINVDRLG